MLYTLLLDAYEDTALMTEVYQEFKRKQEALLF